MAKKGYWLVKEEPENYPWSQFVEEGRADWTGVRNYQARNNLRAMKKGDFVCYYHSNKGREIVGIAEVVSEAYPDPTASDGDWVAVDLSPVAGLAEPVTLDAIKADDGFSDFLLVRNSRLSVMPVSKPHFTKILKMGKTKL